MRSPPFISKIHVSFFKSPPFPLWTIRSSQSHLETFHWTSLKSNNCSYNQKITPLLWDNELFSNFSCSLDAAPPEKRVYALGYLNILLFWCVRRCELIRNFKMRSLKSLRNSREKMAIFRFFHTFSWAGIIPCP